MIPEDQQLTDTVGQRTAVLNQLAVAVNNLERRIAHVEQLLTTRPQTGAERPAAASVAVGTCFFDPTQHRPIWSDGQFWRDAHGDYAYI